LCAFTGSDPAPEQGQTLLRTSAREVPEKCQSLESALTTGHGRDELGRPSYPPGVIGTRATFPFTPPRLETGERGLRA